MANVQLSNQDPREPKTAIHLRLAELLKDPTVKELRILVSYANWYGLSAISAPLEAFLRRGGVVRSLFGIDNGVTTPDALAYAFYLTQEFPDGYRLAAVVPWQYSDSIFHPKFFKFDRTRQSVVLVGSANLTAGGVLRNHEVGVEITTNRGERAEVECRALWRKYAKGSKNITPTLIRRLDRANRLSAERVKAETAARPGHPSIGLVLRSRKRPALFKHILDSGAGARRRHEALAQSDTLSRRPKRLYLQILRETGGGHQVQLPVATLGAFFGVGTGETKRVTFRFEDEVVDVTLTHFANNTHRVRLRPLQGIRRPAIVVFHRSATISDDYRCDIKVGRHYQEQLRHCKEQTRSGSRKWGLA